MKMHLQTAAGLNLIRDCTPHQITVNEEIYSRSIVVLPDRIVADWPPCTVADLTAECLRELLGLHPELVLLGTGARLRFPAPASLRPLVEAGIGYEVMDTAAACRTFNILVGEGRRVLGALLIEQTG